MLRKEYEILLKYKQLLGNFSLEKHMSKYLVKQISENTLLGMNIGRQ
jgi:hypothetical protein